MRDLVKSYGRGLTGLFLLLTGIWIVGLIVLPQARMIERAFVYQDRGGALPQLATEIDRAYAEIQTIDYDLAELKAAADAAASSGTPSPGFAPSLSPSPSPTTTPSPFASGGPDLGQIEVLQARKDLLLKEITAKEALEIELRAKKAQDTGYSLANFTGMSAVHFKIFISTLFYAFCVTILAFLACYPVAYAVAQAKTGERAALLMLGLVIPYAINELLRIFSWVMILDRQGVLNGILDLLGVIDLSAGEGIRFVASNGAVFTVMVYAYILFMVFPIYNTIETLDRNQIQAARDLGASTWRIHWRVVMPHAKPGIAVGAIMTFMLSAGSISVPEIVGRGLHPDWFSQVIYRSFFEADNWNLGSAYSLALLVACVAFVLSVMAVFRVGIREIAK